MVSAASRVLLLLLLVEIAVLLDASLGESSAPSASSSPADIVNDGLMIGESVISTSSAVTNASFVKTFTVGPPESEPDVVGVSSLYVDIPGRVFVSYVDYESAGSLVNSSTLAGINVYSDSSELIDLVSLYSGSWSRMLGTELYISLSATSGDSAVNGSLLVEIAVFRRNQLRRISGSSEDVSVEIIIDDGVARSRADSPKFTTDSSGYLDLASGSGSSAFGSSEDTFHISVRDSTTLYFLSPTTKLNMYELDVISSDASNVYIEAGDIATSFMTSLSILGSGNIVGFFDSIRAESVGLMPGDDGTVCLVVHDTFKTGRGSLISNEENIALLDQTGGLEATGGFTCTKAQIPDRVPRDITLATTVLTPSNETSSSDTDTSARSSSESSTSSSSQSSSSQSSSNPASTTKPMPVVMLVVGIALTMVW